MVNSEPVKRLLTPMLVVLKTITLKPYWISGSVLEEHISVQHQPLCSCSTQDRHRICLGWEAKHGASIQIGFYSPPNCFLIWSLGGKNQVNQTRPVSLPKTISERIDGVVRQGSDTQQCSRSARSAVYKARPSQAKCASARHYNRSRISQEFVASARR